MLQSERISLEPLCEDDFEFYKKIYSDPDLMEYVCPVLSEESLKKSFDTTIKKQAMKPRVLISLIITDRIKNEKIGIVGLKWNQVNSKSAELGLIILKKYQDQSLSKYIMPLIMDFSLNKLYLKKIIALCEVGNLPGNNVLKKSRFINKEQQLNNNIVKNVWEYPT
jgi:RimJ/RimL family protein N-acetyltransferase